MSSEFALESLLKWWRSIPPSRRPGRAGRFDLSSNEAEIYVLELSEHWARSGPGVLKLCAYHRDLLEDEARRATQDVRAWLDSAEKLLNPTGKLAKRELERWIANWRESLSKTLRDPLAFAPGDTLGIGEPNTFLETYRWWEAPSDASCKVGGPLSDLAGIVRLATKQASVALAKSIDDLKKAFPKSVKGLHYNLAQSPWTAAFVLNWLISEKGVLESSRGTLDFPLAVPNARPWLDQMAPALREWHVEAFSTNLDERTKFRYDDGRYPKVAATADEARSDATTSFDLCPIVPSAYIVSVGQKPLDIKRHFPGARQVLGPVQGQCVVFEFLLSRLEQLGQRELVADAETPPFLTVVKGDARKPVAILVGPSQKKQPISKGGATLAYRLGVCGFAKDVLYQDYRDLHNFSDQLLDRFLHPTPRDKNQRLTVKSTELRGHVDWPGPNKPNVNC